MAKTVLRVGVGRTTVTVNYDKLNLSESYACRKFWIERCEVNANKSEYSSLQLIDEYYIPDVNYGEFRFSLKELESILGTDNINVEECKNTWYWNDTYNSKEQVYEEKIINDWIRIKYRLQAIVDKEQLKLDITERTAYRIDSYSNSIQGKTANGKDIEFVLDTYALEALYELYDPDDGWQEHYDSETLEVFDYCCNYIISNDVLKKFFYLNELDDTVYCGVSYDIEPLTNIYSKEQTLLDWKNLQKSFIPLTSKEEIPDHFINISD